VSGRGALALSLLCGWVLWEHTVTQRGATTETAWRVLDAAEARAECRGLLGERLRELAAVPHPADWKRRVGDREFYEINPTGTLETRVRLYCLPGPTDPRPRGDGAPAPR
jgi:hypothetical protein